MAAEKKIQKVKTRAPEGKGKRKAAPAPAAGALGMPAVEFPPPAYRVMWDWEREGFKEVTRPRLPCVFRCGEIDDPSNGHYVDLTRAWQFFWFDLCAHIVFGRYHRDLTAGEYEWLADRWTVVGATKTAFTNQRGLERFRNYVLEKRMDREEPKIYTLVCGGATLAGTPVQVSRGGKRVWMLRVAHFDGTQDPPPVETIDPYSDPRVFFATTITNRKVKSGYQVPVLADEGSPPVYRLREFKEGYRVNPFPQFNRNGRLHDCPVPLVANEDIYFPLKDLVPLDSTEKPSPYFA